MNPKDPSILGNWILIAIANNDWKQTNRQVKYGRPEVAGYFLHQSLKEYLKAFLLKQGLKITSNLALYDLLIEALNYNQELERFDELCQRVSRYGPPVKCFTNVSGRITRELVKRDIREARELIITMFGEEVWETSF